jgi:DNA-binding transcriptional LysR family regulator
MELRHLHAFATVAEEGHFGKAAERLGISQPPLSRQIQQLEAELGVKLLSRDSRSVTLTREGQTYLDAIRPHLQGLEHAAAAVRISSRQLTGRVRAGFVSNLAYGFMPELVGALKKAAPGIGVELTEFPAPEQLRSLRERRLDIGLAILPVADPALKMRRLFREPLVAILPAGHPMAAMDDIPLASLRGESFVICPRYRSTGFHETILDFCRASGFEPTVNHEASSTAMVTELVAAGLGVALTPESAISRGHQGVIHRPVSGGTLLLEIAAVWLEEAMTPALRTFIDQAVLVAAARSTRLLEKRFALREGAA